MEKKLQHFGQQPQKNSFKCTDEVTFSECTYKKMSGIGADCVYVIHFKINQILMF